LWGCSAPRAAPRDASREQAGDADGTATTIEHDDRQNNAGQPPSSAGQGLRRQPDRTTLEGAQAALANDARLIDTIVGDATTPLSSTSSCSRVCKALQSMGRSVEAVCELAGQDTTACSDARQTLESANKRVKPRCPSCFD